MKGYACSFYIWLYIFIFDSILYYIWLNLRFVWFFQSKHRLQTERQCLHHPWTALSLTLRRWARHKPRDPSRRRLTSRAPAASLWPAQKSSARSWTCRRALKSYVYHLLQVTKNTSVYLWWGDASVLRDVRIIPIMACKNCKQSVKDLL